MKTMDLHTRQHFQKWLSSAVEPGQRAKTRRRITLLLEVDPELLQGRSWPELREMAEKYVSLTGEL